MEIIIFSLIYIVNWFQVAIHTVVRFLMLRIKNQRELGLYNLERSTLAANHTTKYCCFIASLLTGNIFK